MSALCELSNPLRGREPPPLLAHGRAVGCFYVLEDRFVHYIARNFFYREMRVP